MFFTKKISFDQTGLFSDLILDFASSDSSLKPFLQSFPSLKSIESSIKNINNKNRDTLVNVLNEQYKNTCFFDKNIEKVKTNINHLLSPNSYTIITGHQIHMFASPLFFIYKIISVIAYANYLNKNIKNCHFSPCFWMATDDHDFNEINSIHLDDEMFNWNLNSQNAVGNLNSKPVLKVLEKLKKKLIKTEFGLELHEMYRYAYEKNQNYADATRSLLTAFFQDYGLIVIDGNHSSLKKLFIHHFQSEITNNIIFNTVSKTNKLISKKYKPEINALSCNVFYLSNSIRSKIQFDSEKYFSIGHNKIWSQSELLDEINLYPEKFSPNVFFRTIYQQHIIPNVLYVGGPSETSYWLQLKKTFKLFNVHYPILALRSSFLFVSKKESKLMSKYELTESDLFLPHSQKINKILKKRSTFNSNQFLKELDIFLSKKERDIKKIHDFPMNSFYVFEKRIKNAFSKLESTMLKHEKIKNKNLIDQFVDVDNKLFPNNSTQERVCSFIPFYMYYGKSFFELLIQESSIFDNKYIILTQKH